VLGSGGLPLSVLSERAVLGRIGIGLECGVLRRGLFTAAAGT
jgi:hypothetical protein